MAQTSPMPSAKTSMTSADVPRLCVRLSTVDGNPHVTHAVDIAITGDDPVVTFKRLMAMLREYEYKGESSSKTDSCERRLDIMRVDTKEMFEKMDFKVIEIPANLSYGTMDLDPSDIPKIEKDKAKLRSKLPTPEECCRIRKEFEIRNKDVDTLFPSQLKAHYKTKLTEEWYQRVGVRSIDYKEACSVAREMYLSELNFLCAKAKPEEDIKVHDWDRKELRLITQALKIIEDLDFENNAEKFKNALEETSKERYWGLALVDKINAFCKEAKIDMIWQGELREVVYYELVRKISSTFYKPVKS